ncbi:MAG: hypothetical protein AAF495_12585 [Pseudomonadota bacterium]
MRLPTPAEIAVAAGVRLFRTDLHVPTYRDAQYGRWKIVRSGFLLDNGYCGDTYGVAGTPVLLRRNGKSWETWMAITPFEVESQEIVCRHAWGHTVVMGLGMGWAALNIALRPEVTKVTVVERDPEIIELFQVSGARDGLADEVLEKLEIVEADALTWRSAVPVDVLFADIWRKFADRRTLDQVRAMQANLAAEQIYFWGQEEVILEQAYKRGITKIDDALVARCLVAWIELPLLVPQDRDYPAMLHAVSRRRS